MLGKGLESLIPNKVPGGAVRDVGGTSPPPVPPANSAANTSFPLSFVPPMDTPVPAIAEEPMLISMLPAAPEEKMLPEVEERKEISGPAREVPRVTSRREKVSVSPRPADAIFQIEVDRIRPNPQQPRRVFDETAIRDLAMSIREFGLLQPIVVSKVEKEVPTGTVVEYQLVAGERRWLATKLLGLERIPAIVRSVDLERERLELAVIENLQREDLSPIEMARAFARLQDEFRLTQREIASRLGKSRETVANTMRLLDLPAFIQEAIEKHQISESHGRLLLTITDPAEQERVFRDLMGKGLTTRELQERSRSVRGGGREVAKDQSLSPELRAYQERLSAELGTPVKIYQSGQTGKITISFYSQEELEHIINKLAQEAG